MMALVASVRRDGWCRISSSIALPRLLAVSPTQHKVQDTKIFPLKNTTVKGTRTANADMSHDPYL